MTNTQVSEWKFRFTIGSVGVVVASAYFYQAMLLTAGTLNSPGPGLFPRAVGLAGIAISLVVIAESLRQDNRRRRLDVPTRAERKAMVSFLVALTLYVLLLPIVGQYIAATGFGIAGVWILSNRRWYFNIGVGAAVGLIISWIFAGVFAIPLPSPIWA